MRQTRLTSRRSTTSPTSRTRGRARDERGGASACFAPSKRGGLFSPRASAKPRRAAARQEGGRRRFPLPLALSKITLSFALIQLRIGCAGLPKTSGTKPPPSAGQEPPAKRGIMYTPKARTLLWRTPTGFGRTHCMQCKAGWTRTGEEGGVLTVCLLDREPILTDMTDCDRYEPTVPDA